MPEKRLGDVHTVSTCSQNYDSKNELSDTGGEDKDVEETHFGRPLRYRTCFRASGKKRLPNSFGEIWRVEKFSRASCVFEILF